MRSISSSSSYWVLSKSTSPRGQGIKASNSSFFHPAPLADSGDATLHIRWENRDLTRFSRSNSVSYVYQHVNPSYFGQTHNTRCQTYDSDSTPGCINRTCFDALHDVDFGMSQHSCCKTRRFDSRKQYSKACLACSVNRSNSSMTIMIDRSDGAVSNASRCDGRVVGAYSCQKSAMDRALSPFPKLTASSACSASSSSPWMSPKLLPSASAICRPISLIASLSFVCAKPESLTTMGEVVEVDGRRLRARAIV